MIPDFLRDSRVLIVDDEPANVALLEELLRRWGLSDVVATTRSAEVVELCSVGAPDLILLDLHMPPPDGFEVLTQLAPWIRSVTPVPVIILTADGTSEVKRRALAQGARDFVTKPFDFEEVRLRTTNLLEARRLQQDLHRHGELLERRIRERTRDLHEARRDVLERLGLAAEFRDDDTGEHTRRVGRTASLLAAELGLSGTTAEHVALAAPLHDVGKIAIPDSILLKAGRLSEAEFDQMKQHVLIGAEMLAGSSSPVLETAQQIVLTHHERWDGGGYPHGVAGDRIPIEGRIVAVADVFDALTHERPYKPPWTTERALDTVLAETGQAFDPDVVQAFSALDLELLLAPVEGGHRQALRQIQALEPLASEPHAEANRPASPNGRAVTLREAANALSVSPTTLRRWSDSGRIEARRTTGGHRRFPVDEIRRLRSAGGRDAGEVQLVLPPSKPIAALVAVLADSAQEIHERAVGTMYGERGRGWFQTEEAKRLVDSWLNVVRAGAASGAYEPVLKATAALARGAELAPTSLLERYTYVERFAEGCLRILSGTGTSSRSQLVASRRLFTSLQQLLLRQGEAQNGSRAMNHPRAAEINH